MEGDQKFTKLIEAIIHDTTPVHYISMVSEELKWVVREKYCFNVDTINVKIEIPMHKLHQKTQ